MRIIHYPRTFIDGSIELEGTEQDWETYMKLQEKNGVVTIAEYAGQHTKAVLLKVANERVTFWIQQEVKK